MNEHLILLTLFVYVLAGVVKGAIGIGFPTAAIAFSALFLDARAAISLVVIPMILINAWQIYRSGNVIAIWIKNQALILSMVAMILLFSFFAAALSIKALTFTLGLITGGFAVVSLWKKMPRISNKHNLLAQVVAGLFSGMLGGIAAIWAPPIVMYLSARQVDTEEFVQTVGLMLFIGSIVLFIGYWQVGIVSRENALLSLSLIIPALIGFTIGERVRTRLGTEMFRKCMLGFFLLMGLNLIRRAYFM